MMLGVWLFYLAGQLLHVVKRASLSASSKLSGVASVKDFLHRNWLALFIRWFLATALLLWWASNPLFVNQLLSHFGVAVGFELPLTKATAAMYGFFCDSILDWVLSRIPILQNEVPPINGTQ